ncbi:MAG TPA: thiamine pyrophosphate-dependent enzyme [Nitrososphaeraceae archaeon]|nr:thiamine pyrophosphate-dependent enzyme [Nitrososphaeraceae archaeon]
MSEYENMRAADILVEALLDWNVNVIFGLPGDGINGVIEAIRQRQDKIRFVLVRHEESAAFMACAYAKYTGKLGACLATSGPGAIHLLAGLYDAKADNTPVIAITGTTYSDMMGSSYQQDVSLLQLFSDVASYNNMINSPEHAEMTVDIACRTALSQRGVSHVTIPIDVQEKKLGGKYTRHKVAGHTSDLLFYPSTVPSLSVIQKAATILNEGKQVAILAGQGALGAGDEVLALAEKLKAPVVKALLGKAVIPDTSEYSLGGIGLLGTEPATDAMAGADTLLMVGTSFPYIDYLPKPGQVRGIQIDIKPERVGLRYPIEVGLIGDSKLVLSSLIPLVKAKTDSEFLRSAQHGMKNWNLLLKERSSRQDKPIKPQMVASILSDEMEENAIISVDSGTNTIWAAQYIQIKKGMMFSVSGTLASMACGLPYAIAAQIAYPDRQSIAFVGDGGFTMLMGEFATAVQYGLPIKVIIIKNNTLGMIRWEQMAFLGNPEFAVEFTPIDYVKFAEACGGAGYSIKDPGQIRTVLHHALAEKSKPTIVEVYVDPFEPPMPPKVEREFISKMAESFAKGQPYARRIGLTLFRNQVHETMKGLHSHSNKDEKKTSNGS